MTAPPAPKNVNPFYIEKASWEGDYDWSDDDEAEGLLERQRQSYSQEDEDQQQHRRVQRRKHSQSPRAFQCICFLVVFVVLFVLLSISGQSNSSQGQNNRNSTQGQNNKPSSSDYNNRLDVVQQRVVILGERNSGVDWLETQLQACYSNVNVSFTTHFNRHAFWFQGPPWPAHNKTILFMFMVRNPYDWTQAMRLHPQFMPYHTNLSIQNLTGRPWTIPIKNDTQQQSPSNNDTDCQLGFGSQQVVPCQAVSSSTENPIYELDSSGKPFDNILKLRAAKIRHWMLEIPQHYSNSTVVHYQDDVSTILERLDSLVHQHHRVCNATFKPSSLPALSQAERDWLTARIDWEAEALIGYHKDED